MTIKIVVTLQDKKKTMKNRITSLIKKGIIRTKYSDIGKAREVCAGLKEQAKRNTKLRIIDKTRAGVVEEIWINKSERALVKMSLDQANKVILKLKKEDSGIHSKVEIFHEEARGWVKE